MQTYRSITIPDADWDENGDDADVSERLIATIEINGLFLHVEAIAVVYSQDGSMQCGSEGVEDAFDSWYDASGSDGHVQTLMIKGREYALFASPFC